MGNSVAANPLERYEQTILSYAALCYAMACELTRNPEEAGDLARKELLRVRQLHENLDGTLGIKMELLAGLWKRFLGGDFGVPGKTHNDDPVEQDDVPSNARHFWGKDGPHSHGLRARVAASRPGGGWQKSRPDFRECAARHRSSGMGHH